MRVAARAGHGETKPDRAGRLDTVESVFGLVFIFDGAALAGAHVAADVTGGNFLHGRRVRQQIARKLFGRELVERHVLVERVDDPLAVFPDAPFRIDMVAMRVGVARRIKPVTRLVLAVSRRVEQTVHQLFVGVLIPIGKERVHFLRCWGQACQVIGHPANQRGPVGFRGGFQPFLFQTRENEIINLIARPFLVLHRGQRRAFGFDESPVALPIRSFRDPTAQRINLRGRQRLAAFRRRHHVVFVLRGNARDQFALFRVAGHDGQVARFKRLERVVFPVESEFGFALLLIRTMAGKALVGENRPDVPVEINGSFSRSAGGNSG